MKKVVIHIFHDDKSSIGTGSHVSERIRQVKEQHDVDVEVYVFGPAERAADDPAHADYRQTLVNLTKAGCQCICAVTSPSPWARRKNSRLLALLWNTRATPLCATRSKEQRWSVF